MLKFIHIIKIKKQNKIIDDTLTGTTNPGKCEPETSSNQGGTHYRSKF